MKRPECFHIPTLHEGETALISWAAMDVDTNYIVERSFNESFSQSSSGYTWDNIDSTNEAWNTYDQEALSWYQIETRTGRGQSWERLDYEGLSWSQIESRLQTWKQLESKEISFEIFRGQGVERTDIEQGRTWLEFDGLKETWSSLEKTGHSWTEVEKVTLPGLEWEDMDAKWLTFDEWEKKGLTFQELDTQKRVEKHRGMTDTIPFGAANAMYRIKAYGPERNESDYLTTAQLPVIPVFYRNSVTNYPVKAGRHYLVLLNAQEVRGLDKIRMNLHYNQYLLELTDFAAGSQRNITKSGDYPEEHLKIYSAIPGKVWFQSTKASGQNECFSGAITLVEFIAKGTGTATVSLS